MNTSDNSNEDITTDYNNSEGHNLISNTNNNEESITNSDDENQTIVNNDPYTQLFIDNPDNPFYKCKIDNFNYDTDDEENYEYIRIVVNWNFEFNYDFFNIIEINGFISKSQHFKDKITELKSYRNNNNTTTTGILLKLKNDNFKIGQCVHIYLIVYYDNAKCNIQIYGIFDQEIEENKLISNVVSESIYGKVGKIISNTNINSTGGEGFIIVHNLIYLE